MSKWIAAFFLVIIAAGCYRMPTEEDYCVTPLTNNPDLTREPPQQQLMPKVSY